MKEQNFEFNYFYVRHKNFVAVFQGESENCTCKIVPSQQLSRVIKNYPGIKFEVDKIFTDQQAEEDERLLNQGRPEKSSETSDIDMEEIQADLARPINIDN